MIILSTIDAHPHPSPPITWLFQVVLREVIDALGGWKAAVYFEEGGVNLDVEIGAWPVEDQVSRG